MPNKNKSSLYLNAFLVKESESSLELSDYLKKDAQVRTYSMDKSLDLEGVFFVKIPEENKPKWGVIAEKLTGVELDELGNRSSSAVLIIKSNDRIMAFTFGYGRYLINTKYFIHDFGIKTALNVLDHSSLRSVDLFSLDDQAVQKKAQASRESGIDIFGIDISKDILRAVTGSPKKGVDLYNVSGADFCLSFNICIDIRNLPSLVVSLIDYYGEDSYKDGFSWVDNIRKVKEKSEVEVLDEQLIKDIKKNRSNLLITLPEIVEWDTISGFSFTRSKHKIAHTIITDDYLSKVDKTKVDIDSLKRDRVYVHSINGDDKEYSIYNSIYYEIKGKGKSSILFSGEWYEIDNSFISRIDGVLQQINLSKIKFPKVYVWEESDKNGKLKSKIETEGDYNDRVSKSLSHHLLDRKLIKSNRTTTSIELCDLLTDHKQFIHVKHRKGGSSGLSHLFAQGSVSAEILLGDREFRKAARRVLKKVKPGLQNLIPLDGFKSDGIEIIFLILGEDSSTLRGNLPFFSKVNLSKTYESLSQRGFNVSIAGVGIEDRPQTGP